MVKVKLLNNSKVMLFSMVVIKFKDLIKKSVFPFHLTDFLCD